MFLHDVEYCIAAKEEQYIQILLSETILLKFTEISESEYCSYCFFKKITNRGLFHSAQSSLIYFV